MATDADESVKTTERTWTFAPGQLISLIVGIGFVAVGLLAMVRAGIDGSFETPVVEVLGFTHTAWLGLAEVGLGVLLILAGTGAWGRPLSVILGVAMVIAGVLIGAAPEEMPAELGVEEDFGWALARPWRPGRGRGTGAAGVALAPREAQRRAGLRRPTDVRRPLITALSPQAPPGRLSRWRLRRR